MAGYQIPLVAHHTDGLLIASGPLATLFAGGGPRVGHQWQMPTTDCRLRVDRWWYTSGFSPLIATALWTTGEMLFRWEVIIVT